MSAPDATVTGLPGRRVSARSVWICIALVLLTWGVYAQTGNHEFLGFDDDVYVAGNPHVATGINGGNIAWAFTSVEQSNWHPVTWLSHMADAQLFGLDPRGHHLSNVALHSASALLLLLLLFRLTGAFWQSAFVAAVFALHPAHVESVAWVAERKDLLSALFWFLTTLFYAQYVRKGSAASYLLSLFCFMLGLMSKPMLVTLPVIMLLMDYWPLKRYPQPGPEQAPAQAASRVALPWALFKEKLPFFACALLSGLVTVYAQHHGGAMSSLMVTSVRLRLENALVSYVKYLGKTIWPSDLAVLYPMPAQFPLWQVAGALFVLLLVSAAAIRLRGRYPFLLVGWFWFVVTLLPVIGLIRVGNQAMADRYLYLPMIGLLIVLAWGAPVLLARLPRPAAILAPLAGAVIAASALLTWQQLGHWRDNIALFQHALQVTSGNYVMHNNLGVALSARGDIDAAIEQYRSALSLEPSYAMAHDNLGVALAQRGDRAGALQEYRLALQSNPRYAKAHYNLGVGLAQRGDLETAVAEFEAALRLNPAYVDAYSYLGIALAQQGDLEGAIRQFSAALNINPYDQHALRNREVALAQKRMKDGAGR